MQFASFTTSPFAALIQKTLVTKFEIFLLGGNFYFTLFHGRIDAFLSAYFLQAAH